MYIIFMGLLGFQCLLILISCDLPTRRLSPAFRSVRFILAFVLHEKTAHNARSSLSYRSTTMAGGLGIKPETHSDVYDAINPTKLTGSLEGKVAFVTGAGEFL